MSLIWSGLLFAFDIPLNSTELSFFVPSKAPKLMFFTLGGTCMSTKPEFLNAHSPISRKLERICSESNSNITVPSGGGQVLFAFTQISCKAVFSKALAPIVSRDVGKTLKTLLKLSGDFSVCVCINASRSQLQRRGG